MKEIKTAKYNRIKIYETMTGLMYDSEKASILGEDIKSSKVLQRC